MTDLEIEFVEELSWDERQLPQKDRTEHVHGIHPYLGKYVPQLVDYFLERYFREGDKVLDPFVGSGTTLVEANIRSMYSTGVDISEFNTLLCKVKTDSYELPLLKKEFSDIIQKVKLKVSTRDATSKMDYYLAENPFDEDSTAIESSKASEYLRAWYHPSALYLLLAFRDLIPNYHYRDALKILLCRTARSSRLAPHYQLDFPERPFTEDYYCHKHARICHPTMNALGFLERYTIDTYNRIAGFQKLRTPMDVTLVHADSREIKFPKSSGAMTSPPYIGLIDYHEQHRYAYELLGLKDRSGSEIGAKKLKNGKKATEEYRKSISKVISRLADAVQGPIIFVVNDKYQLYDSISESAQVKIVERLRRKVNRRTGRRSKREFYEDIIVMKA